MSAYDIVQGLAVAGIVGYAAFSLARRFVPKLRGKDAKTGGCADCDACGNCASPPSPPPKSEQPLRFHR